MASAALPGVHKHLTSLHNEVRASHTDISELTEKVESCSDSKIRESVKEVVQQCLGPAMPSYSVLARSFYLMAASLRSSLEFQTVSTVTSTIIQHMISRQKRPFPYMLSRSYGPIPSNGQCSFKVR
jgi:hypothetical protein